MSLQAIQMPHSKQRETTAKICLLKGIIDSLSYWCCYDAAEIHPQMFSIMPNPYKCTMQPRACEACRTLHDVQMDIEIL